MSEEIDRERTMRYIREQWPSMDEEPERPKATSKGVFKALTEPIPPRPDVPEAKLPSAQAYEPFGPEGKGGIPSVDLDDIMVGHDVGGIVHVLPVMHRSTAEHLGLTPDQYIEPETKVDPPNE